MKKYYTPLKRKRRGAKVTVCIAAINNGMVIMASDRMVTAGDIEFEPPVEKLLWLTTSIAVLTAGDQSVQMQVFYRAYKMLWEKIAEDQKWADVSLAAEIYSKCFYDLRNKMVEDSVLSTYNLTFDSFLKRQKEMSDGLFNEINNHIQRYIYNFESVAAIVCGIDTSTPLAISGTSPHIYVVDDGEISCHDKLGFVAIGAGRNHAESHFMLSKYSVFLEPSTALLITHQAKKKSEICPGVGENTDMFVIGGLGKHANLSKLFKEDMVIKLDGFYKDYKNSIEALNRDTEKLIGDYFSEITKLPESTTQEPSPSASPSSSTEAEPEGNETEGNYNGKKE
jgi:20S proteasome alpha/beta subunit